LASLIYMSINWNEISSLSTFGLLVATIILVLYGKGQMRKISSTSRTNFLLELKRDFFTETGREIYALLQHNLLQFQVQKIENSSLQIASFIVRKDNAEVLSLLKVNGQVDQSFTVFEIDNYLLTHLEDLGFLYEEGELTIGAASQLFGHFIIFVWEHEEIKKYIEWVRTDNAHIYRNFECIYHEVIKFA
jgi:hypothetical protein